jgi:hypothetical protein
MTSLLDAKSPVSTTGLVLVSSTTIGSAVSSITVNNAFSATYDNYKILISGGVGSTSDSLGLSLGGITTGYYANMVYQSFGSTTVTGAQQSNVSNWIWSGSFNTSSIYMDFDVQGPFLTKPKKASSRYNELSNSATNGTPNFWNASTTSATNLTITASSGTVTGGTIYVYGYK